MVLQRWDPFRDLRRIDQVMDRHFRGVGFRGANGYDHAWAVPLDVTEDGDNIVVRASLPGIKPEDIEVTIENGTLAIKGETEVDKEERDGGFLVRERRAGKFYRTLRLPESVDTEKAETAYANGVLTVTLTRVESEKAKRLEVKAA